jgi:hypothetical protein
MRMYSKIVLAILLLVSATVADARPSGVHHSVGSSHVSSSHKHYPNQGGSWATARSAKPLEFLAAV